MSGLVRRVSLPRGARRLGRQLLTQQCWCWGQDIKRGDSNLLCDFGFEKLRPPSGERGATSYRLASKSEIVVLWGFGLYYGEAGANGIFVGRFDFSPRFMDASPVLPLWEPKQLHATSREAQTPSERWRVRELLSRAARWIAAYEGWIALTTAPEYRRECLSEWACPSLDPSSAPELWLQLARECHFGHPVS